MRITLIIVLFAVLNSCGSPPKVPVSSRDTISVREQTEKIGGEHVMYVRTGDTLYSIAFGAGLSPIDIAAWNGISPDRMLYAGQKLRLTKPLNFRKKTKVKPSVVVNHSNSESDLFEADKKSAAGKNALNTRPENTKTKQKNTDDRIHWQWPTVGRISSAFSIAKGNKGIDISGRRGQDVKASAAGKVVYAGNGLRGYGNLLIVKHNEDFLSAYAHNDNILVKEGQFVNTGQRISVMGVAKHGEPVLHFEIRLQGRPVNPVQYLPK